MFLCRRLGGEEAPVSWRGRIPDLTYKIGGSFVEAGMKINVHITTTNKLRKTYNVIGYIGGAIEPGKFCCKWYIIDQTCVMYTKITDKANF